MEGVIAKPIGCTTHYLGSQVLVMPPKPKGHLLQLDKQCLLDKKGLFTVVLGIFTKPIGYTIHFWGSQVLRMSH